MRSLKLLQASISVSRRMVDLCHAGNAVREGYGSLDGPTMLRVVAWVYLSRLLGPAWWGSMGLSSVFPIPELLGEAVEAALSRRVAWRG